jgi:hypothetical protein
MKIEFTKKELKILVKSIEILLIDIHVTLEEKYYGIESEKQLKQILYKLKIIKRNSNNEIPFTIIEKKILLGLGEYILDDYYYFNEDYGFELEEKDIIETVNELFYKLNFWNNIFFDEKELLSIKFNKNDQKIISIMSEINWINRTNIIKQLPDMSLGVIKTTLNKLKYNGTLEYEKAKGYKLKEKFTEF